MWKIDFGSCLGGVGVRKRERRSEQGRKRSEEERMVFQS